MSFFAVESGNFLSLFQSIIKTVNGILWADWVLYVVLFTGVLFTIWSKFAQYRALTHGVAVVRGLYDDKSDPGAISHFQALSAALSATVGLGNIGGVALAIALGGPGAVFWMWVVGFIGMALKMTEVTLAMLYRNVEDPENPHGGAMWVASKGFAKWGPFWAKVGNFVGGLFCVTLIISSITGGNMFQAWNVADITHSYFNIPQVVTGIVLSVLVGMVIIGGIKRIGQVAGKLVPFMSALYFLSAIYVIAANFSQIPELFRLIISSAFSPLEAQGAFIGGTAGYAFLWGMKRALFSNEAGQGSAPIAHSAAKTHEPVREAVVAGLEPFIDTIVICTLTALVILSSGLWRRQPDFQLKELPRAERASEKKGKSVVWKFSLTPLPKGKKLSEGTNLYAIANAHYNKASGNNFWRIDGQVVRGKRVGDRWVADPEGRELLISWKELTCTAKKCPKPDFNVEYQKNRGGGVFLVYQGATLTGKAFDSVTQGLGKWMVTIAAWLFALSTMISWSYYGEQGVVFLFGESWTLLYKVIYCLLIVVASIPQLVATETQLDNLTSLGTGVMLWVNIPIMLIFGYQAMSAYHDYIKRLDAGEFKPHSPPEITELIEGKDE